VPTAGFAYGYIAFMPKKDPAALGVTLASEFAFMFWLIVKGAASHDAAPAPVLTWKCVVPSPEPHR
jgi:hypothetical protein